MSRQLNSELMEKYMAIFENYLHHYHQDTIDKESVKEKKAHLPYGRKDSFHLRTDQ